MVSQLHTTSPFSSGSRPLCHITGVGSHWLINSTAQHVPSWQIGDTFLMGCFIFHVIIIIQPDWCHTPWTLNTSYIDFEKDYLHCSHYQRLNFSCLQILCTFQWHSKVQSPLYFFIFLYPRSPKGEGGILFYLCPSFRPSKIFFVAFFSVTVDGKNLIFGHKRHIGIPYSG